MVLSFGMEGLGSIPGGGGGEFSSFLHVHTGSGATQPPPKISTRAFLGLKMVIIWSETLMELIFNLCGEFR